MDEDWDFVKKTIENVKNGGNPNVQNNEGKTALMLIVEKYEDQYENMFDILLNKKALPNIKDFIGRTALMWSIISRSCPLQIVEELLEYGAYPNIEDESGKTALTYAVEIYNDENLTKLLLKYQANPLYISKTGLIPIMQAAKNRAFQALKILIDSGIDLDTRDLDGQTLLMHTAAATNYVPILKYLIIKGANIDLEDNMGETAIDYAKKNKNNRSYQFLLFTPLDCIAKLQKDVEKLRNEVKELRYVPGHTGYMEAKEHYMNISKKN